MLTPEGLSGEKTDKVMLLAMWSNTLKKEAMGKAVKPFISAGMGKPTYPINIHTVEMFLQYWKGIEALLSVAQSSSELEMSSAALDYGDGRGDIESREIMSEAMTRWYNASINKDNILFTVGGAGALRVIFETFNELYKETPRYRVITPFPHYSLYSDNQHQLHPIQVMDEPGYQLTAKALQESIASANKLAEQDNNYPRVLLFSNPSNPLGTIISETELIKIAEILRQNPSIHIVMDEAYAEMYWHGVRIPSLLSIAPDLKDRMVILRSATKALSAAGERMAMLMAFSPSLMSKFRDKNISTIGHAPRSAQLAYAHTMAKFSADEQEALRSFYKPKVDFVYERLKELGAAMPDPTYCVEGTFYVLGDFSDLLETDIPMEAKRALGKVGKVRTSEELAYSLLFKESLMLAPCSYFGMPEKNGFLRITCSGSKEELADMLNRLESCLYQARQNKAEILLNEIAKKLTKLSAIESDLSQTFSERLGQIRSNKGDCKALSIQNKELQKLLTTINVHILGATPEGRKASRLTIYSFLSKVAVDRKEARLAQELKNEWKKFVDETASEGPLKNYLLNLSEKDKAGYKPWIEHLKLMSRLDDTSKP